MDEEARDLRDEVRKLKGWLVAAVGLFTMALVVALWGLWTVRVTESKMDEYRDTAAYLKAQYENHKVQLYELDNRLTQTEAQLIALKDKE